MLHKRVIPVLQIQDDILVKTCRFKNPRYIGDPINAIKIFNEKEVDELIVVDISATLEGRINFDLLSRMNKEAFMPLGYGGGIRSIDDVKKIFALGYEKVVINHIVLQQPDFITMAANICGSQSVVVCVDVKTSITGKYYVYDYVKKKNTSYLAADWIKDCEQRGAGELILNDVDREGTFSGYNLKMLSIMKEKVNIPVVALGGAANVNDLQRGMDSGLSAMAAGSMFVFYGPHKAVLFTYPDTSFYIDK